MYTILQKLESIENKIHLLYPSNIDYRGSSKLRRTNSFTSLPLLRKKQEDGDAQVVDVKEFMNLNAKWWKYSPNEKKIRMTPGGLLYFPTNYMTTYTLEEIGNDMNIIELNQHCISINGQPSTTEGKDTTLNKNMNEEGVTTLQRGYLIFLLPIKKAFQFFNTFKSRHMMSIEFVNVKEEKFELKTNNSWKDAVKKQRIWLTCNIKADGDISFPTNQPNRPILLEEELSSNLNRNMLQFNNYIFCELHEFACITIITSEVGLDDDKVYQGFTPEFVQLAKSKQQLSLPQQVTAHLKQMHTSPPT